MLVAAHRSHVSAPTQTHSRETLTGEELAIRKTHTHTHVEGKRTHDNSQQKKEEKRSHKERKMLSRRKHLHTHTHTLTGMCDLQEQPWRGQPGKGGRRSTPSSSKSVETNRDDELTKKHTDT